MFQSVSYFVNCDENKVKSWYVYKNRDIISDNYVEKGK